MNIAVLRKKHKKEQFNFISRPKPSKMPTVWWFWIYLNLSHWANNSVLTFKKSVPRDLFYEKFD
jgi:hypothetical protein